MGSDWTKLSVGSAWYLLTVIDFFSRWIMGKSYRR